MFIQHWTHGGSLHHRRACLPVAFDLLIWYKVLFIYEAPIYIYDLSPLRMVIRFLPPAHASWAPQVLGSGRKFLGGGLVDEVPHLPHQ